MGARAETARRLTIESGSPMSNHSMSNERMKQGSEGEGRMKHQRTGGRKAEMAERRRSRLQGKIQEERLVRLEEAIGYLNRCDWQNDDAVKYVRSATQRLNGAGSIGGKIETSYDRIRTT